MAPRRPWRIPHLVPTHGTVLEAARQLAAEQALFRLAEVAVSVDRCHGGRDPVEDAEDHRAGERDVEVFDDDHVFVDAGGWFCVGEGGAKGPGKGGEGAVAVAGVVRCEGGRGDGEVGVAVDGEDVVVAGEELAGAVGAVFGAGEEAADEGGHF